MAAAFPSTAALRFTGWTLAYLIAGVVSVWFAPKEPNSVTLIWPAAGVGFCALMRHGIRYWPTIALALVPLHVWISPVPGLFVLFSIVANTLGTVIAVHIVNRTVPPNRRQFSIETGFRILGAGLVMVMVCALIGAPGLYLAGLLSADRLLEGTLRWAMSDLVGLITLAPALMAAFSYREFLDFDDAIRQQRRRNEILLWTIAFVGGLVLLWFSKRIEGSYALAVACVPLALVIWASLRFHPVMALSANALFDVGLATVAGLGLGGFRAPTGLSETTALTLFLVVTALIPQILTAANYQIRVASHRQIKRAKTDSLTRLPNRAAFDAHLRQVLAGAAAEPYVLCYVDLDQFKVINDSLSHAAGDAFVIGVAGVLAANIDERSYLARIGGDEFAVVFPESEADVRAPRMLDAIAALRMPWRDQIMATTASIGLAPFFSRQNDYDEVLARADAACQTAKELGGNRLHWATGDDAGLIEKQTAMRWAVRLTQAIDEDRFELHCQSIVPLRADESGRHFEILLRMIEPGDERLLLPAQFVAAAERFKLGPRLDRHVFDKALTWFERSSDSLSDVFRMSINLSATTLVDERFPDFVRERLRRSNVPAEKICFEITETSAVRDLAKAARLIDRIREQGCKFALDDFGTGFCSFAYLASLRVDYFKIDGSFVRDLGSSPLAMSIVRAIVDIGKVTGTQTVAECVETAVMRAKLGGLGVDFAQGYAIDRPRPITEYFRAPPPDTMALVG